jgi:putative AdoMet-dependent methyltransferase
MKRPSRLLSVSTVVVIFICFPISTLALAMSMPSPPSSPPPLWQFQELQTTIGKDYQSESEVDVYDDTHATFRDIREEARQVLDDEFKVVQRDSGGGRQEVLLDFGCGTGTLLVEAAKRGLIVHGIDVSPTMIRMAQSKVQRELHAQYQDQDDQANNNNVFFHHAGFLTYQHDHDHDDDGTDHEGGVDYITTTYALHHLPDIWKQVALQRLSKMLKPHGKLHIRDVVLTTTTTNGHDDDDDDADATAKIQNFVQAQAALGEQYDNDNGFLKDDAETHFREEFSTFDWVLEGMLERAGLEILRKHVADNHVIVTYICQPKKK